MLVCWVQHSSVRQQIRHAASQEEQRFEGQEQRFQGQEQRFEGERRREDREERRFEEGEERRFEREFLAPGPNPRLQSTPVSQGSREAPSVRTARSTASSARSSIDLGEPWYVVSEPLPRLRAVIRFCPTTFTLIRHVPAACKASGARLGVAWLGLAWLGLAWLGLAWLGLAWLGLAWLGFCIRAIQPSLIRSPAWRRLRGAGGGPPPPPSSRRVLE